MLDRELPLPPRCMEHGAPAALVWEVAQRNLAHSMGHVRTVRADSMEQVRVPPSRNTDLVHMGWRNTGHVHTGLVHTGLVHTGLVQEVFVVRKGCVRGTGPACKVLL